MIRNTLCLAAMAFVHAAQAAQGPQVLAVDASTPAPAPLSGHIKMGTPSLPAAMSLASTAAT